MINNKSYQKKCGTYKRANKELAMLSFLASSSVHNLIPIPLKCILDDTDYVIEMSLLQGLPLSVSDLCCHILYELGVIARNLHEFGDYHKFGLLNDALVIQEPESEFSRFIERQISKWRSRSISLKERDYLSRYSDWLFNRLTELSPLLNQVKPVFCHGDFDLKNILAQDSVITGLVDWEHAGIFCLEWELRKLSRFFHDDISLLQAFFDGYSGHSSYTLCTHLKIIKFLEASDLLGHLSWCFRNDLPEEYNNTMFRMNRFYTPQN